MTMKKCAIIVPCYNEAERIDLAAFGNFIDRHDDIHFIFVNDGSKDNTADILQHFCTQHKADTISLEVNSGKAEAVRQGMQYALKHDVDYIGFWDADLATPLFELENMLELSTDDTVYISGCRLLRLGGNIKRKLSRHLLGRVFATAVSCYLDLPVYDTQCGAKIYRKDCIPAITEKRFVTRRFFDVEIIGRMIRHYGKDDFFEHAIEHPLSNWIDIEGSKINYITCLKDFILLTVCRCKREL